MGDGGEDSVRCPLHESRLSSGRGPGGGFHPGGARLIRFAASGSGQGGQGWEDLHESVLDLDLQTRSDTVRWRVSVTQDYLSPNFPHPESSARQMDAGGQAGLFAAD